MAESAPFLTSELLAGLPHGFFGRRGGVSDGIFASLNVGLGSADDMANVAENRRRVVEAVMPGASLCNLYQIHSARVVAVTEALPIEGRPEADAMVTDRPGLLLGILTADCVPVLYADREAGVVGAAHSGWKGAIGGVNQATIAAMEGLGARRERIVAAIGPCIAQDSYQVGFELRDRFVGEDPTNEKYFRPDGVERVRLCLESYVVDQLHAAKIGKVDAFGIDTYANEDTYFSYRRTTHRGEPDYGRQVSVIGLPE